MSWTWGGRAVRVAALVGEQTLWHYAGWWIAAGRTVGDHHPRLWCALGASAFFSFCPIVRAACEKNCNLARGDMLRKSVQRTRDCACDVILVSCA
eukprot:2031729-Prymnesium_polylepis.1